MHVLEQNYEDLEEVIKMKQAAITLGSTLDSKEIEEQVSKVTRLRKNIYKVRTIK